MVDLFLKLDADFDKKILNGSVTLTVERVQENATHLVSIFAFVHMNFNTLAELRRFYTLIFKPSLPPV